MHQLATMEPQNDDDSLFQDDTTTTTPPLYSTRDMRYCPRTPPGLQLDQFKVVVLESLLVANIG